MEDAKHKRWRFIDSSNDMELQYRAEMKAKSEAFWHGFEQNIELLRSNDLRNWAGWMSAELAKISKNLMFELSGDENGIRRITITPETAYYLHPFVESMLALAPNIDGYKFMANREPVVLSDVPGAMKARIGKWIPDVRISGTITDVNSVDLVFYSDEFRDGSRQSVNYCALLCEILFGQEFFEKWMGNITPLSTSPGFLSKLKSMFGKPPESAHNEGVAILESQAYIAQLRNSITERLPSKPLCLLELDVLDTDGALLSNEGNEGNGRATFATGLPKLFRGLSQPPMCFSSERFSRCGETFCYLKFDGSVPGISDAYPDRASMEEAFDAALRKASIGCVTGGGWGTKYNYIDFALLNIEESVPVLRRVSSEINLPKESWLKFLDMKLKREWIGMHADSPEPAEESDW